MIHKNKISAEFTLFATDKNENGQLELKIHVDAKLVEAFT